MHPFDRVHGTDTSGFVAASDLKIDGTLQEHSLCYAGSSPAILRMVLASIPDPKSCAFLDLGCGKGRPLLVASEFPFRDIVGVEYAPDLAAIARRNAALVAERFPSRRLVKIEVGDASTFSLPSGNLVIFLYHPFDEVLMARVVAGIEAALTAEARTVYVIYYNPVAGHCFDSSPQLKRRSAQILEYGKDERGFGPDEEDTVVIWQGGSVPPVDPSANARIVVGAGLHAFLERSSS